MATTARQQYFADESSLSKDKREFSISVNIQNKIDSVEPGAEVNAIETVKVNGTALVPDASKAVNIDVPDVVDNLYSTSTDDALSAKQGKVLYDYIQNISFRGRFLSNWNCATGLPTTNPSTSPYQYLAGDYYTVSNISTGGTNYRPEGSSYTIGIASTTVETSAVNVSDMYLYDGSVWVLMSGRQIAIDTSLSTISINPVENRVITNALNSKAEISDVLTKTNTTSYTPTTDYHPATKKYVDDNINTKTFFLTGTTGQSNLDIATEAYEYWKDGGNPIIIIGNAAYILGGFEGVRLYFLEVRLSTSTPTSSYTLISHDVLVFSIDLINDVIDGISFYNFEYTKVLETNINYSTPYTPQYDGSPATKKYVDDKIQYVTQDEYTALLPGAASDGKHYFIYTEQISPTPGWQPGPDTIAYYEMNGNLNDSSSNGYNLIGSPTQYNTLTSGIQVAQFDDTDMVAAPGNANSSAILDIMSNPDRPFTISFYMNVATFGQNDTYQIYLQASGSNFYGMIAVEPSQIRVDLGPTNTVKSISDTTPTLNTWYNYTFTYNGVSGVKVYKNGIYVGTVNISPRTSWSGHNWDRGWVGYPNWNNGQSQQMSKVIFEKKEWTAQEISDYYDQTKADYGIS